MVRLASFATAFLLALTLGTSVSAAETGTGKIEGVTVNRTAGGTSVSNANVTLRAFQKGLETEGETAQTDTGGHFIFADLPVGVDYSYQVIVAFQGVEYASSLLSFDEGKETTLVEVPVYDTTTDAAAIKVMMGHTVIYIKQGTLDVKEYAIYVNSSDRTLVGAADRGGETLRFTLPAGATDIAGTLGLLKGHITSTDEGFSDTLPFPPGMKEIAYSYILKLDAAGYDFVRQVDYPTDSFDLLVQRGGVSVSSLQLESQGLLDIGGAPFIHLTGKEFSAGEQIKANLSGFPSKSSGGLILWIIIGIALVAIALACILVLRLRQSRLDYVEGLGQRKEKLLVELADLDERFEKGLLPGDAYRSQRAEKKARLVRLLQRMGENGEGSKPDAG